MKVVVCSRSFSRNEYLKATLLKKYPNTKFNDQGLNLFGESLVDFIHGYDKAIVGLEYITASILDKLPDLKVISKYGVGLDSLDLIAMRDRGVKLGWTPGVNKRSVSELVISSSIVLLRKMLYANLSLRQGVWNQHIGRLLTKKTFGIIGLGQIGQDVVSLLKPYECTILACDILDKSQFTKKNNVQLCTKDFLLENSDIVSLHVPLDELTKNMITKEQFSLMKRSSILLNYARGGIVNEADLLNALKNRHIFAAASDVFCVEPPDNNELISLDNFYASPHLGGSAEEAMRMMGEAAIRGLDDFKEANIDLFKEM